MGAVRGISRAVRDGHNAISPTTNSENGHLNLNNNMIVFGPDTV